MRGTKVPALALRGAVGHEAGVLQPACSVPTIDETSKKLARAKAMAAEAQDTAARVQAQLQDMQRNLEQWQGQFGGLRGQDLGQVVLDAGHSGELAVPGPLERRRSGLQHTPCAHAVPTVSSLEKTLPQLLAKLSLLENRGAHNASLALSASIGRVRELIAQARGAASKVGRGAGAAVCGRPDGEC